MLVVARGISDFAEAFPEIRMCPMLMYVRCAPVVDLQENAIRAVKYVDLRVELLGFAKVQSETSVSQMN